MKQLIYLILCMLAVSCAKDPTTPDPDPNKHPDYDANVWIYANMSQHYLYNSIYNNLTPDYNRSSEEFFNSLLSSSTLHNDGKHPNRFGDDYFYSYMERTGTKSLSGLSYGFDFILYRVTGNAVIARILYVVNESAAQKAGLDRGDWITKINGNALTEDNYHMLMVGSGTTLEVRVSDKNNNDPNTIKFTDEKRTVTLSSASIIEDSPLHYASTISLGSKKVGYLVYNAFRSSKDESVYEANGKYNLQMRDLFSQFKSAGVTDFVLDLRYNVGGYLDCANLLASLIIKEQYLGNIFSKLQYNTERVIVNLYNKNDVPENINMSKLYILTTQSTASASELMINGLRPYIDVVVIGDITEGKNVGSYAINSNDYNIHIQPITSQIYNSRDESDYKEGFIPDITAVDLDNVGPNVLPFGNKDEYLFNIALNMIEGNNVQSIFRTKGADSDIISYKYYHIPRISGTIITR